MVRIWGRWCGPNWTAGQRIPAKDYDWKKDPSPRAQDNLDSACRLHDSVYGQTNSSSARSSADRELEAAANKIANAEPLSGKGIAARSIALAMAAKEAWE